MAKSVVEVTVNIRDLPEVKALIAKAWSEGYGAGRDDEAANLKLRLNPFAVDGEAPEWR